jgi:hypothetical protein
MAMPSKITAWSCQFKCGRRVCTTKSVIEKHEARCFSNPAMRACKTCGNFDSKGWANGTKCNAYYLDERTENNPDGLRSDCKMWVSAEHDEE